jgi:hypothetical protein
VKMAGVASGAAGSFRVISAAPKGSTKRSWECTFESRQYALLVFSKRCSEAGWRPSMGSVGDCFDNAMRESFYATLECELLNRRSWRQLNERPTRHPDRALGDSASGRASPAERVQPPCSSYASLA